MTNLAQQVCSELHSLGFKKDVDPRSLSESYNLVKNPDGSWFKSTKPGLHDQAVLTPLDTEQMPALKELNAVLGEEISGRLFIQEYLVFMIKKGTQTPLLVFENTERADGVYRKLCDEIIQYGVERDRFRTEETYMLTKTPGNEWSVTSSHENYSGRKTILELNKMPLLKSAATKINKLDSKFQTNGGRIFITPKRIYRLNNKVEVILKI